LPDRERPRLDHQLKRAAEQKITHENTGLIAEHGIGGGLAPAQGAAIDHVIVKKGGSVP